VALGLLPSTEDDGIEKMSPETGGFDGWLERLIAQRRLRELPPGMAKKDQWSDKKVREMYRRVYRELLAERH
jgi:hypothetical protein